MWSPIRKVKALFFNTMQTGITAGVVCVLLLFMVLATWLLSQVFYNALEQGVKSRLEASLYGLMGVAEPDSEGQLVLPSILAESDFNQINSGVFAWVEDEHSVLWRSPSSIGQPLPSNTFLSSGDFDWREFEFQGQRFWVLAFGSTWLLSGQHTGRFQFSVAQDKAPFLAQVQQFKRRLIVSFFAVTVVLVFVLVLFLRWGFKPLSRLAQAIELIETGKKQLVSGEYPWELKAVVHNLNALIESEQKQRERYRNTLADLAHSLKTPLTVLQRLPDGNHSQAFSEQVERMDHIIQYHLKRSVRAAAPQHTQHTALYPVLEKILLALGKVYREKAIDVTVQETQSARQFSTPIDSADVYELLGNILDNAFKYCHERVTVSFHLSPGMLKMSIEDDGPGIAPSQVAAVLERWHRLDVQSAAQGQGIGLSVVQDICQVYAMRFEIEPSPTVGGACIHLYFPGGECADKTCIE